MPLTPPVGRKYDAVCLGRAGVDFYAQQFNTSFSEVESFEKHVGGSPANIAIGMARLGSRVALSSVISDDMLGRYVIENLKHHGVDTSAIRIDKSDSRTSLAITEIKPENCEVVIYRNNAADLSLAPDDIPVEAIAGSRMLILSGTALSVSPSREASLLALQTARSAGTVTLLDLDYRPYSWTNHPEAGFLYKKAASLSDILIGNREEFAVMLNQSINTEEDIATVCFEMGVGNLVIVKDGDKGSVLITKEGIKHRQNIFEVDAVKPFGAGDAFAAAFSSALLDGWSIPDSAEQGAAAAAMVVASIGCGDATPERDQLSAFIEHHKA